jgi:hypothetical protein
MTPLQRLRHWTMRLPNIWGLGQAEIHSSLLLMLGLLSLLVAVFGSSQPGLGELLPAAITLPIVWVVSLAVRVAAQQLALGDSAIELETTVGPTGNLSTDYEYLPPRRLLCYSIAGQLASFGLVLLGMVISAALIQADGGVVTTATLFDLRGGWQSAAWASQIMWVNLFLSLLHFLPTVPFDMRAVLFALFSLPHRNAQEPLVFRRVAGLVSHLSTFCLGVGSTTLLASLWWQRDFMGWYAATAAAVYLFVAAQWEGARADELEEQYVPVQHRQHGPHQSSLQSHLQYRSAHGLDQDSLMQAEATDGDPEPAGVVGHSGTIGNNPKVGSPLHGDGAMVGSATLDVDEILRKLHREGQQSLSPHEKEALLTASRHLQKIRSQSKG